MTIYYHGTNSKFMASKVAGGTASFSDVWVGYNYDYCARRARKKAAEFDSTPVVLRFDGRHPGMTIMPLEDHQRMTGDFKIEDLVFIDGPDFEGGLYEIARAVKGAVLCLPKNMERRIIRPSVGIILKYVRSMAHIGGEPNEQYLRALEVGHDWDAEAVRDLKIAAANKNPGRIDEIVERAVKIR